MRSDREELPDGYTKEEADQTEIAEAADQIKRRTSRAAVTCQRYWPVGFDVCGAIRDKYNSLGAQFSFLSFPTSGNIVNPGNTGERVTFVNGPIYWSSAGGAHPVVNSFVAKWGSLGWEASSGMLGYPTTDEIVLPDGGRRQEFQRGVIYVAFQNAIGSAMRNGLIRDKFNSVGGLTPGGTLLGYPIQDPVDLPDGQGRMTRFERGVIYWHPTHGAHWITGPLLDVWSRAGYENGEYGYPRTDTVPRAGDAGSSEQTFVSGSMYIASDRYFEGIISPAVGPIGFRSYDTGEHPAYTVEPDLSLYGSTPDPTGTTAGQNIQFAGGTEILMRSQLNAPNAADMFNHYYGNTGLGYGIPTDYIDLCTRADTQLYGDDVTASAAVASANRDTAVQRALAEANQLNRRVKFVTVGRWNSPVASNNNDCVLGFGRFGMSSTTAVIAEPGAPGTRSWQARQAAHVQDIYDFAFGQAEYPPLAQSAVNNAYNGMLLGVAKPFLAYGTSSDLSSYGSG